MTEHVAYDSCGAFDDGGGAAARFCVACGHNRESHNQQVLNACSECDCGQFVGNRDAAFCRSCGHSRSSHPPPKWENTKACKECDCTGFTGPDGAAFCTTCGHDRVAHFLVPIKTPMASTDDPIRARLAEVKRLEEKGLIDPGSAAATRARILDEI